MSMEIVGRSAEQAAIDRFIAAVSGAQALGIRAVLRRTEALPIPEDVHPDAVIDHLSELPAVVTPWL